VTGLRIVFGPVLVDAGVNAQYAPVLRRVQPGDPLAARAREVEVALRDVAPDLGFEVEIGASLSGDGVSEAALITAAAAGVWVVSPRLEATGNGLSLRMIAVPPNSPTLLVRSEKVDPGHVAARAVVVLRDFLQMKLGAAESKSAPAPAPPEVDDEIGRSRGRPILVTSSTLFGLYSAFAIHRTAGREDPRLLYPLLALGSGLGLGGALLAAEEWDVTVGAAWTIAAGSFWGTVVGLSSAAARDVRPVDERPLSGLVGGLIGTTMSVAGAAIVPFDDGDAAVIHSGAVLAGFGGGVLDLLGRGTIKETPYGGIAIGTGLGLVSGGVTAAFVKTSTARVLLVDLGAGLGALAGASIASPLVFRDETPSRTRGFLASVLGGTIVGGAIGWFVTRDAVIGKPAPRGRSVVVPTIGLQEGTGAQAWTAGVAGVF
jgi:hypothetical protein